MKTTIHFLTTLLFAMSLSLYMSHGDDQTHASDAFSQGSTDILFAAFFKPDQPAKRFTGSEYNPGVPDPVSCKFELNSEQELGLSRTVGRSIALGFFIIPSAEVRTLVFPFHGFW